MPHIGGQKSERGGCLSLVSPEGEMSKLLNRATSTEGLKKRRNIDTCPLVCLLLKGAGAAKDVYMPSSFWTNCNKTGGICIIFEPILIFFTTFYLQTDKCVLKLNYAIMKYHTRLP